MEGFFLMLSLKTKQTVLFMHCRLMMLGDGCKKCVKDGRQHTGM